MEKQNKLALVVEGGAMRGIFSAGILDAFIEHDFNPFDICIGVSAGANNLTSLLAGTYQRSYNVYTKYNVRNEFINWRNYLKGGHFLDLDWLWDITIKELPINTRNIVESKSEFYVGVTDVKTGKIKYIKPDETNIETVLKASSCIPLFYRHFIEINEEFFVDGGIADPIPVKEAINHGANIVVVLRSRPYAYTMKHKKYHLMTNVFFRKYPKLKESLNKRSETYHQTIEYMRAIKDVTIIEVNPPDNFKTKRLTKELTILEKDYQSGYHKGLELVKQLTNY